MGLFKASLPRTSNSPLAKLPRGITTTPPANVFRNTLTITIGGGGEVLNNGIFSYTPKVGTKKSSGGVYQIINGVETLVRTLWSGRKETYNSNIGIWDGRLDDLTVAPAGTYYIKLLYSSMIYEWEGVLGNSSYGIATNAAMHRGYAFIGDSLEVGNYIYFSNKYVEGASPVSKLLKTAPQTRIELLPRGYASGCNADLLTTDGTLLYTTYRDVLGEDHSLRSWVSAISLSNDQPYTFSAGTSYTPKQSQANPMSTIGLLTANDSTNPVIGLAVQKTGNLLAVCHKNVIDFYNKTTGAFIATNTSLTNPRGCYFDKSDKLKIISGTNTVASYTVSASGVLSAPIFTLSGIVDPISITTNASGDDSQLLVGDGGSNQQYLLYSNATGAYVGTLSQLGGYNNTPTVAIDRHYISDAASSIRKASAVITSNGDYWLLDAGNYRYLNFNSSKVYIQQISYLQNSYSSAVDANNPRRVFSNFLEFDVDPTKPIKESWTLVKNWRSKLAAKYFGMNNLGQNVELYNTFSSIATLSNGRTYGFIKREVDTITGENGDNRQVLIELDNTTGARVTNLKTISNASLGNDGSLNYTTLVNFTDYSYWTRALTGFDSNNDPIYATAVRDTRLTIKDTDPADFSGLSYIKSNQLTSSGKRISFQHNVIQAFNKNTPQQKGYGYGYHLGMVPKGGSSWSALTARATSGINYTGDYPSGGEYDIGNRGIFAEGAQQGYAGGGTTVLGRNIFWNFYGEFWKDGQTNKWHQVYDNGLFIDSWGPTSVEVNGQIGYAGMAGGVHFGTVIPHPTDPNIGYIYHGEEGGFSGVHRWKLTGLAFTEVVDIVTISVVNGVEFTKVPDDSIDLHKGLPYLGTIAGVSGWSQSLPDNVFLNAIYQNPDPTYGYERVVLTGNRTSLRVSDRFSSPGLSTLFIREQNKTFETTRDIGTVNSKNWKLVLNISHANSDVNDNEITDADSGGSYREIRDATGKVIIRFGFKAKYTVSPNQGIVFVNGVQIASAELYTAIKAITNADQDLVIENTSSGLKVTYASYPSVVVPPLDSTASVDNPKSLVVVCWHKGNTGFARERRVHTNSCRLYIPKIVDLRTTLDATLAIPSTTGYNGPLMVLSGMAGTDGIIRVSGNYVSTDPSVAAITLNCGSTPVVISNCNIVHAGRGISGGTNSNLTAYDCKLYGSNPALNNTARERSIYLFKPTKVDIHHVTYQSAGGIKIDYWNGGDNGLCSITNIKSRNVIGKNGDFRHCIQLSNIHTSKLYLAYIESYNEYGKSRIEDTINMYNCGGISVSQKMVGKGFFLQGSYHNPGVDTQFTGAALSADGSTNPDEVKSQFIDISDAWLVSNEGAAANIAAGSYISYSNIKAVSTGYANDGTYLQYFYRGFSISDFYQLGAGANNFMSKLTSMFMRTKDIGTPRRADFIADPAISSDVPNSGIDVANAVLLPTPASVAAGLALQTSMFTEWIAYLNTNGQLVGSRI